MCARTWRPFWAAIRSRGWWRTSSSAGASSTTTYTGALQVDSTGAGDAFLAGLMYGLYHAKPIAQSIAYGNVTGGACVQQLGCLTAFVDEPTLLREAALLRPEG